MEWRVYDASGKYSDKYRMYFVVVPEGFGDEIPTFELDNFENTSVGVTESTYTITGKILSGSETGEVYAPSKTIKKLKSTKKGRSKLAAANKKKRAATKKGKQHARHGLHKGKKR